MDSSISLTTRNGELQAEMDELKAAATAAESSVAAAAAAQSAGNSEDESKVKDLEEKISTLEDELKETRELSSMFEEEAEKSTKELAELRAAAEATAASAEAGASGSAAEVEELKKDLQSQGEEHAAQMNKLTDKVIGCLTQRALRAESQHAATDKQHRFTNSLTLTRSRTYRFTPYSLTLVLSR
jgi:predicted RNase H-like nuclease (RuvC/YqgF family)